MRSTLFAILVLSLIGYSLLTRQSTLQSQDGAFALGDQEAMGFGVCLFNLPGKVSSDLKPLYADYLERVVDSKEERTATCGLAV